MNRILKLMVILGAVFIVLSCKPTNSKKNDKLLGEKENFAWLLGRWKQINDESGKETFENWGKQNETSYVGIGFTMENGDTIKQEKMRIVREEKQWNLIVKTPEEKEWIAFPITKLKNDEFTSTNDSIDFPKEIKYWKNGENIYASVSGDSLKINFEFEKIKD